MNARITIHEIADLLCTNIEEVYELRRNAAMNFPPPVLTRTGMFWWRADFEGWLDYVCEAYQQIKISGGFDHVSPPQYIAEEISPRRATVPPNRN